MTKRSEWVAMDPADYEHLDAQKVEAFQIEGRRQILVVQVPRWEVYSVLHLEEDGFSGLEQIDTLDSFEEAKDVADAMAEELLAVG
jgi:hypothetical protein